MKRGKGTKGFILLIIAMLAGAAGGCEENADTKGYKDVAVAGMEDTPILDYVVPQLLPNILINKQGYPAGGEKRAALKGSRLPKQFSLVEADSGDIVYTGEIQEIDYNEELKLYVGYADFSDYCEEGSYYLESDYIGRSYIVNIESKIYQRLFEELYHKLVNQCKERSIGLSEMVAMLTAYEWYPEVFPDENRDEVPDILSEYLDWIEDREQETGEEPDMLYVALLAKFSYLYQKFDRQYATDCLRHASAMFEQAQKDMTDDAQSFYALTELYRATGYYTYRNQISDYKSYFENNSSYLEEPEYLYGAMTYMVTRQKVDMELCDIFMSNIMDRGEEIATSHNDTIHPLTAKNNGCDDLLKRSVWLSCANYVLSSYQYDRVMEEFVHYLMGTNLKSVCFYPEEGSMAGYLSLFTRLAVVYGES